MGKYILIALLFVLVPALWFAIYVLWKERKRKWAKEDEQHKRDELKRAEAELAEILSAPDPFEGVRGVINRPREEFKELQAAHFGNTRPANITKEDWDTVGRDFKAVEKDLHNAFYEYDAVAQKQEEISELRKRLNEMESERVAHKTKATRSKSK